ncbi:MAG: preprotein translocase subunit YajC [Treponema sp.]|nr:preprotein translocase subunit YajC [Treponema sp.]
MNHFVNFMLMGAPGGGQQGGSAGLLSFLPIVLIFGVFWFFMIRPQNKQRKETQRMLSELKKGDKVVTIGGIHGVVQSVRENSVILKVDESCKIEFTRSAIASMKEKGDSSGGESAD